jgi:competence protein ComEA
MTIKPWIYFLLGLLCALLAAGLIILISSQPTGEAVQLIPPPTASPIFIDISGEIKIPGLYSLPVNSRLEDAIDLAGGLSTDADLSRINRAEILHDGDKIVIPQKNSAGNSINPTLTSSSDASSPININSADLSTLQQLPGIGPAKAQDIIDYRNEHGNFQNIEQLMEVPGIGDSIFQEIKDLITISN